MASTNPARGTRDFLPADVRKREYVIGIIKRVYESYGFEPLETPAFENLETLTGKYGEEGGQLMFKILKRGEKLVQSASFSSSERDESRTLNDLADLALRYDLTVPLARVVANNRNKLPVLFKRYQIQPVWRADRPAKGRYREFYQCDVDWIGSTSPVVEAELISAAAKVLSELGFHDAVFRLNDRRLLTGILDACQIVTDLHSDALVALDKLDKIGSDGVAKELAARGISSTAADALLDLFSTLSTMNNAEKLTHLRSFVGQNEDGVAGLESLEQILNFGISDLKLNVDPSLARGLSYYTGMIVEVNVPDLAGSLAGGGRYDGLIGMFGKEQIPACGLSLGLERILVVMDERRMFPPEIAESTPADVLVTIHAENTAAESLKFAAELRAAGIRTTVYPDADKLGKQLKYAASINVRAVCILGESEIAAGTVTIKNMLTGEQQTIERASAASFIRGESD
ncbi:MAG: Histidine--tRNA ligase [Pyrinomonadaceae bacterium]|nr:Histidine--tRNA ligase [Pyrinomonadaceae bacterium]